MPQSHSHMPADKVIAFIQLLTQNNIEVILDGGWGAGTIKGFPVKCITPDWMVKFHTGYKLDKNDYRDVKVLCERFGPTIPPEYEALKKRGVNENRNFSVIGYRFIVNEWRRNEQRNASSFYR